jgi:hypothetical protein
MLVSFPALDKPPPEFRTLRPFRFAAKRCSFIRELPTGRAEVPSINDSKVPSAGAPSEITKRRGPCDAVGGNAMTIAADVSGLSLASWSALTKDQWWAWIGALSGTVMDGSPADFGKLSPRRSRSWVR